eukprot:m.1653380 g.1653380  ORF g.1653380 m.1653380 type:complete len:69 (-) comp96944_c0_seq1:221-427(-)
MYARACMRSLRNMFVDECVAGLRICWTNTSYLLGASSNVLQFLYRGPCDVCFAGGESAPTTLVILCVC